MRTTKKAVYMLIAVVLIIAFTTAAFLITKGNLDIIPK